MSVQARAKPQAVRQVARAGERVARSTAFEALARAGFVARGVIYAVIGILAVKVAVGASGKATNQTGALRPSPTSRSGRRS